MARRIVLAVFVVGLSLIAYQAFAQRFLNGVTWPVPMVVTPGKTDREAPSDAVVLFDGLV